MHPDVRLKSSHGYILDADTFLGRRWPPLASAQNDRFFGAYLDGYSHQHLFHVQPTARHLRRSKRARR